MLKLKINDTENVVDNEEPTEDPDLPEDPDNSEDHDRPQELQRSTRERRRPDYYMQQSYVSETPITYKDATISPDKAKWKAAMEAEMKSLEDNSVWTLVNLPSGCKTVGSKWVFKQKTGPDGSVERFKARLVAQGYNQQYGRDYDETFCPVVRQESLRVLLALSAKQGGLHRGGRRGNRPPNIECGGALPPQFRL